MYEYVCVYIWISNSKCFTKWYLPNEEKGNLNPVSNLDLCLKNFRSQIFKIVKWQSKNQLYT